jgi:hypothetical protein
MMRAWLGAMAMAVLALPASAQEWTTGFNMGTFLAGGGSDATGYLNFECADESSGFSTAGQPFITLTPMAGVVLNKKFVPKDGITFWVEDEFSYLLPMSLEAGGQSLNYDYSAESVQSVRDLVAQLRKGSGVTAYAGDTRLVMIPLQGSAKALEFIDGCIQSGG